MANASNYAAGGKFNSRDAVEDKGVVVMVTPTEGSDTSTVVSAGTVTQTSSGYVMTVENEGGGTTQYIFDAAGQPVSTNAQENNYSLMMAETTVDPVSSTVSDSGTVYTRGTVGGKTVYTPSEEENAIVIDSLNAKDQFAIQILKSIFDKTKDPSALSKTQVAYYCEMAYNWAGYMMKESSKSRAIIKDENPSGSIQTEEVTYLEGNTEKLLNNIAAALDKTNAEITLTSTEGGTTTTTTRIAERITVPEMNKLMEEYVKHTPTGTEPSTKTTVGLDDLISAIKGISSSVGSSQTTVDFTDLITAINTTHTQNIGGSGLGRDKNHPLYISGGGFPNKDSLAASIPANSISDFLTFNGLGAVGYSSKAAVQGAILGYLAAYEDLASLCNAIVLNLNANGLYNRLESYIDTRIKAWLQAAKDAENRSLTVNTPT